MRFGLRTTRARKYPSSPLVTGRTLLATYAWVFVYVAKKQSAQCGYSIGNVDAEQRFVRLLRRTFLVSQFHGFGVQGYKVTRWLAMQQNDAPRLRFAPFRAERLSLSWGHSRGCACVGIGCKASKLPGERKASFRTEEPRRNGTFQATLVVRHSFLNN